MDKPVALLVVVVVGAVIFGLARGWFGDRGKAGTTPTRSSGGFASKRQVKTYLSAAAARRAGAQVRPSLTAGGADRARRWGRRRG